MPTPIMSRLKYLALPAAFCVPGAASAYTQDTFFALWQEYQQFCGRMLANPIAFHDNPAAQIGASGDVEHSFTQDRSGQDYILTTPSQTPGYERLYQMSSYRVSDVMEQSCVVADVPATGPGAHNIQTLAAGIQAVFASSPGFDITGGAYVVPSLSDLNPDDQLFTVTGAFQGQMIMTLITISEYEIFLEHTHLSSVAP
ncbi:MAG: hypothetical protein AAF727_04725 [Pseudomonadota bacterium]